MDSIYSKAKNLVNRPYADLSMQFPTKPQRYFTVLHDSLTQSREWLVHGFVGRNFFR